MPRPAALGAWAHRVVSRGLTRGIGSAALPLLPWLARRPGFRSLARRHFAADEPAPSDLIHVLGGGAGSPTLRIDHGLELFRRGLAPLLYLTGSEWGIDWADRNGRRARGRGVPESALLRDSRPRDTRAEARALRRLADERGLRSVIVVTEPFHTGRVRSVFTEALRGSGVRARLCPAAAAGYPPENWWRDHRLRALVLGEWVRLALTRVLGS